MAYSTDTPPALYAQAGRGTRLWVLLGTDAVTSVREDGYITDGWDLGMRAGDLVQYIKTDASPISTQMMIVSTATEADGVDLSDGLAITATNTD